MRSMLTAAAILSGLAGSLVASYSTPEVSAQGVRLTRYTPPRKFYLTIGEYNASNVLTACASGYHLASYWEIYEPSNFVYDTARGQRSAPYQFGPPVSGSGQARVGWIETGQPPSSFENCSGWTIDSGQGFTIQLQQTGGSSGNWSRAAASCAEMHSVWCVSDPPRPCE